MNNQDTDEIKMKILKIFFNRILEVGPNNDMDVSFNIADFENEHDYSNVNRILHILNNEGLIIIQHGTGDPSYIISDQGIEFIIKKEYMGYYDQYEDFIIKSGDSSSYEIATQLNTHNLELTHLLIKKFIEIMKYKGILRYTILGPDPVYHYYLN